MTSSNNDDVVNDFLTESYEALSTVVGLLMRLEKKRDDMGYIDSIYRSFHTIKGNANFLGFQQVQELGHIGENVLSQLREKKLTATSEVIDALLGSVDLIQEILHSIESEGKEAEFSIEGTLSRLNKVIDGPQELPEKQSEEKKSEEAPPIESHFTPHTEGTVRVKVEVLERIMGELKGVTRHCNDIVDLANAKEDIEYEEMIADLSGCIASIESELIALHMQPIKILLQPFERIARDLGKTLGKEVELTFRGEDTEVDKVFIESLQAPLLHMVRNSIDHGIEPPETRELNGKERSGSIYIRASINKGNVIIEYADDGKGISREQIVEKAIENQLLSEEEVQGIEDFELFQLIFKPGFSMAKEVTDISGRGVGMDVVKESIEKLGGKIYLQSRVGRGTGFIINLPRIQRDIDHKH